MKLPGRYVHPDARQQNPLFAPASELSTSLAQHPFTQAIDQPGLFREMDEMNRSQQAALGMVPANQRFGARNETGLQVELRLIAKREFITLQSVVEIPL